MSISVSAAGCQTWFDQTSVSVVLVPTTVFAQKIHKLYFPYYHLYTSISKYPNGCYLHTIIVHRTVIASIIKAITVLCM